MVAPGLECVRKGARPFAGESFERLLAASPERDSPFLAKFLFGLVEGNFFAMKRSPSSAPFELVEQLRNSSWRLALAESCTCGMVAAMIGGVPGASTVFCGSLVTYRASAKTDWLGVDPDTLRHYTAESQQTTDEMARCLVRRSSEADWGAAITGHLGPDAPASIDGRIFVALARRQGNLRDECIVSRHQFLLSAVSRSERQTEASQTLIRWILSEIEVSLGNELR